MSRIAEELDELSSVGHRYAGSEGERRLLHEVRNRLPVACKARVEGFVAYTSSALIFGVHAAALLLIGFAGLWVPATAAILCALVTASLVVEGTGRYSLLRRVLPKSASYNLVHRRSTEGALGTVVVAAPLDAPRWRSRWRHRIHRPMTLVLASAIFVTAILALRSLAEPWGRPTQGMYVVALLVLAVAMFLGLVTQRHSGADVEDASGVVALLDFLRRGESISSGHIDIWSVFTGCGHAYQNGMGAFLAMHKGRLVEPVLVVALDEPGRAPLGACISEGVFWPEAHRPTGPALIERLRWAGATIEEIDSPYLTDASAATRRGYRAVALGGGTRPATVEAVRYTVDILEALIGLYERDLVAVAELSDRGHLEHEAHDAEASAVGKRDEEEAVAGSDP